MVFCYERIKILRSLLQMDLWLLNEKMKVDMLFHLAHLSFRLELDF